MLLIVKSSIIEQLLQKRRKTISVKRKKKKRKKGKLTIKIMNLRKLVLIPRGCTPIYIYINLEALNRCYNFLSKIELQCVCLRRQRSFLCMWWRMRFSRDCLLNLWWDSSAFQSSGYRSSAHVISPTVSQRSHPLVFTCVYGIKPPLVTMKHTHWLL